MNPIRKGLAVAVIVLFVSICVIPSTGINVEKVSKTSYEGNTLYVGGSGPGNYTKIQDAINDSVYGDTVYVYSGIYFENLYINELLFLIGEDCNSTIIDGRYSDWTCINLFDTAMVTGFTIQNASWAGIIIDGSGWSGNSHGNLIYGNIIKDNKEGGILIGGSSHNKIHSNYFINNTKGLHMFGYYGHSSENHICKNTFMKNVWGIELGKDWGGNARENYIYKNNFIRNLIHARDYGYKNNWDTGIQGNYWDNWIGLRFKNFRSFPHIITSGILNAINYKTFFKIKFDHFPALEPYDIGV